MQASSNTIDDALKTKATNPSKGKRDGPKFKIKTSVTRNLPQLKNEISFEEYVKKNSPTDLDYLKAYN